ncbi:PREDICTED: uncharacterized protein LOC109190899 [Ipomoea nil]|uniref:uncharacterized protein LOC109190899 n=1 Tax=Ipomoea nil TaxID=35883 RepID=UPI0009009859|nr:PREDICTED: uncharacterized protein LOC109190899 [Ipomoea nil]
MTGGKWRFVRAVMCIWWSFLLASLVLVLADEESGSLKKEAALQSIKLSDANNSDAHHHLLSKFLMRETKDSGHRHSHVWPELKFGWKIVVGSIIGFLGAAFGSVGGVGGGGIFVPMLTLILRFDPKSATAISKCMITGAAVSTVYCNLRLRHPTLEMPIIDYDLAVLIQPMLMLGISIGVSFNVILADWMVTVLLIILFLGLSTMAFFRGVASWKKETMLKKEAVQRLANGGIGGEGGTFPGGPSSSIQKRAKVSVLENVYWKEFGLIFFVWVVCLGLQISKNYTTTCSTVYWGVNLLQIPVCLGVSSFEAFGLYKGWRKISSKSGDSSSKLRAGQLIVFCFFGLVAGTVGALLGLGGGFIMGPLFLELGVPPEVSTATSTFVMMFTSSIAVVEYYLLKRFPVPYAVCLTAVATVAAFVGQHVVRRVIAALGRASLIIFTLAFIIFISAISLGGVGISNMTKKIEHHQNMGFESLCKYRV